MGHPGSQSTHRSQVMFLSHLLFDLLNLHLGGGFEVFHFIVKLDHLQVRL